VSSCLCSSLLGFGFPGFWVFCAVGKMWMVAESWMDVRMVGREYLANLRFLATYRIQTWALEEARRRLEIEGLLEDPEKK
jgi:hypothetical protein